MIQILLLRLDLTELFYWKYGNMYIKIALPYILIHLTLSTPLSDWGRHLRYVTQWSGVQRVKECIATLTLNFHSKLASTCDWSSLFTTLESPQFNHV